MRKFYLKTLFLACTMLMSVSSVWGATSYLTTMTGQVGTNDNAEQFYYATKKVKIAAGETYVYTLINYNNENNSEEWKNWVVEGNLGSKYFDCEARGHFWQANGGPTPVYTPVINTSDVSNWQTAYNGATVTISISRNATGDQFTITHTSNVLGTTEGNTSKYYGGTFTVSVGAEEEWDIYLTEEYSHFLVKKVIYTNADGGAIYAIPQMTYVNFSDPDHSYGEIAYGETAETGYNLLSGTYPSQTVGFGNTGWGVNYITYINTDASDVPGGATITNATLTFQGSASGGDVKTRSSVFGAGYNSSTWSSSMTYTTTDKSITTVGTTYTTASAKSTAFETVSLTITDAIKDDADKIVNTVIYETAADHSYIKNPELTVVYSNATLYEVTFNETNSLNPTITVYTDAGMTSPIAKNELAANTTYYYRATLESYNDYEGSFEVGISNPTVNFTMTAKTRYTFTVNAVDAGSNVIKNIYTDADSYEGKSHTIVYPKYLTGTGNIVTYSKDNNTYGESKTAQAQNETYTVSYTAYNGVAWYVEVEDVVSGTGYDSWNCSNGRAVRGFTDARNIVTVPATGTYDVTYAICNNNVNNELSCTLSKNSDEIFTTEGLQYVSINYIRTTGIITNNNVSLESGDVLKLAPSSTNGIVDYMLVELKSVPATIGSTGWTTFASAHPLDLSNMTASTGDVTAYYASAVNNGSVTMTSTESSAVAAGEGLMLKGTAGATITIPVVASGTAIEGNKLVGCTTSTVLTANSNYYVLVNNSGTAEFQCLDTNGATIPAGKAYLNVPSAGANLRISFDADETTGINIVECSESTTGIYNLSGQRVMNPTKGLYIMNGKKVYIK